MRLSSFIVSLLLALTIASPATASPEREVEATIQSVIAALEDSSLDESTKHDRITSLIKEKLDKAGIVRRVLATNWHTTTLTERRRFTNLFIELVVETYWNKIKTYQGQRVEVTDVSKRNEKLANVNSVIYTERKNIPVDYRLRATKRGSWLVYDVAIEQISLVRTYRTSFHEMIQKNGIEHVLVELERKIDSISAEN